MIKSTCRPTNGGPRRRGTAAGLRVRLLALSLVAAIAAAGITGCRAPEALVLTVPWAPGEVSLMDMVQDGQTIGSFEMKAEANASGGWNLLSETLIPAAEFTERIAVQVDGAALAPTRIDYELVNQQGTAVYTGLYGPKDLVITANVFGQAQTPTVRLPDGQFFDNEQVLMTLRALPLRDGWRGTLSIVVSRSASKAQIQLEVTRQEEITTNAGTFPCWVVELRGAGQRGWVHTLAPHQLVRYENDASRITMSLSEFAGGD